MRKLRELLLLTAAFASGQNIPDIRDSLERAPAPESPFWWMLIPYAVALAIVILVLVMWLKRRIRRRAKNVESPESLVQRRLANINISRSAPRAFYTDLHRIFVEYLENRIQIKASRCTAPELLDRLSDAHLLTAEWRSSVEKFLADCDRAKFSLAQPDRELDAVLAECRHLINQVATAPLLAIGTGRRSG